VGVGAGVRVEVGVDVCVGMRVGVRVGVGVKVTAGMSVGVGVTIGTSVAVEDGAFFCLRQPMIVQAKANEIAMIFQIDVL